MINPKKHSIKALTRTTCNIDRYRCHLSPTAWFEAQHPENFDLIMQAWEEKGKELLQM